METNQGNLKLKVKQSPLNNLSSLLLMAYIVPNDKR